MEVCFCINHLPFLKEENLLAFVSNVYHLPEILISTQPWFCHTEELNTFPVPTQILTGSPVARLARKAKAAASW